MKYSIVITAYNRAWCIERALVSSLRFLELSGYNGEVVVVDDGSTDDTVGTVERFRSSLDISVSDKIRIIAHKSNKGVCAAKNSGIAAARGHWIIILDSDDELLFEHYQYIDNAIDVGNCHKFHFFSTLRDREDCDGDSLVDSVEYLDVNKLVLTGTGGRDAVPVVDCSLRTIFKYKESINGYEGLLYIKLARILGAIPLHSVSLIRAHLSHDDRLSSRRGLKNRHSGLLKGHLIVVCEHWDVLSFKSRAKMLLRCVKAATLLILSKCDIESLGLGVFK